MDTDAVWFITGCSSGFGRHLAMETLRRGWRVVVTARSIDKIAEVTAAYPERALPLALDVADPQQRTTAIRRAEEHFGRIDVLVNNAGSGYFSSIEEADLDAVRDLFEVNFYSVAGLIQSALPGMRSRRSGTIVNIGSIAGIAPFPATGYYAATKHALEGLTRVLRQEVAPLGIRVMAVEPGGFRTEFSNRELNGKRTEIADYVSVVGRVMDVLLARRRDQRGDPARGARVIIDAATSDSPPRNLILGEQCYMAVDRVLSDLRAEMAEWKEASLSADFPQ